MSMSALRRTVYQRAECGALAVLLGVVLTACAAGEGSGRGGANDLGVKLPPSAAPGPAGASQRLSINTESVQGLAAGLRANGVDDAEHWAQVIMHNRPYPPNDPGQQKLRDVLAQYRADPATTAQITNALKP
jgi:hypothetical protein